MENIRPISDLRNKFKEISEQVNEQQETVFLTKNGYGSMVVMSMEEYYRINSENEIVSKLREAEIEARESDRRYSHEEVISKLRGIIDKK